MPSVLAMTDMIVLSMTVIVVARNASIIILLRAQWCLYYATGLAIKASHIWLVEERKFKIGLYCCTCDYVCGCVNFGFAIDPLIKSVHKIFLMFLHVYTHKRVTTAKLLL